MISKPPIIFRVSTTKRPLTLFTYMVVITITSILIMTKSSLAQDTPEDFLEVHNEARAAVGVGPLTWSEEVASYARRYAESRAGDCQLVHSEGPYGENIAWGSDDMAGSEAVKMWVDERLNYDYYYNSCASGKECGHYTQVVWSDSVRLGCAKVRCDYGGTFITCNYDPPGNSY